MGNVSISIKRFLGNKNTVTILGVIVGIVVLYVGYNWRVNQAVEPVSVPYAKTEIRANSKITNDMIGVIKVSKSMIDTTPNLVTTSNNVIGKFVNPNTTIPENSLFYQSQLMEEEETPNYITRNIDECYTIFSLPVNLDDTYGNSIMPGDYIDLYITATDDSGLTIFGKFIESIKVQAVRDSQGKNVFSSESNGVPNVLVFSVPNDMHSYLVRASLIGTNNIKIKPVPRNAEYTENHAEAVTNESFKNFIDSKSNQSYDTSEIDNAKCNNKKSNN